MTREQEIEVSRIQAQVDRYILEQLHKGWKLGRCEHNAPTEIIDSLEICSECNMSCPL